MLPTRTGGPTGPHRRPAAPGSGPTRAGSGSGADAGLAGLGDGRGISAGISTGTGDRLAAGGTRRELPVLPTRIEPRGGPGLHDAAVPAPTSGAWGHDAHTHDHAQLLVTPLGHAVVWAQERTFHLCHNVAVWIPAGVEHTARFGDDCLVAELDFAPELFGHPYQDATEIVLTARRTSLLLAHLRGRTDSTPTHELFEALVEGLAPIPLPAPRTPIPQAVAAAMLAAPADGRTVTEWADAHYTSATSLRRAFLAETGLTFSEWRTRARINASVELLARGRMVSTVAQQVGFTSTNGFILAFRRYFGVTPKAYATSLSA